MLTYLINQAILVVFNLVNVRIDAYRIAKDKVIAHGINLIAYILWCALFIWIFKMNFWNALLYGIAAFANRQLSFDIPLNIRRHLPWFYQSTAETPQAWWDRTEIKIFHTTNGKKIVAYYAGIWLLCLLIKWIF